MESERRRRRKERRSEGSKISVTSFSNLCEKMAAWCVSVMWRRPCGSMWSSSLSTEASLPPPVSLWSAIIQVPVPRRTLVSPESLFHALFPPS